MTKFLLLRPTTKIDASVKRFAEAGLDAVGCALIDIVPLTSDIKVSHHQPDLIIVTSTAAADLFVEHAEQDVPKEVPIIAVGPSTAKKLASKFSNVSEAVPANSEGVVAAIQARKIKPKQALLLKGEGGRQLIQQSLEKEGIKLVHQDLYKRVCLHKAQLTQEFVQSDIHCIIATSAAFVDAAYNYFEPEWLNSIQWIVVSDRVKLHLAALGAKQIINSEGASDQCLIAATRKVKGS
jgi:uroporphyrinogen-III synthase